MNINLLFEQISEEQKHINTFNHKLSALDEKKRKACTIHPTDSPSHIRTKCKQANTWGIRYTPLWNKYVEPASTDTETDVPTPDVGSTDEIQGSGLVFPYSIGPEDDEEFTNEEKSSTERVRRYYRRHPEKVRKYLKKTQNDRVARNRDRRKAVKKYGKSKMKNHDVHHPNGAQNGNWKLAKKDHGRDKKNEDIQYVYLSEILEGNIPNGAWSLISEGGAAGHMAHPYEDNELTFRDVKEMVRRGLVGELDAEEPVTEKLDGQNIMFSVRDGQVVFARNKGQIKNRAKNALDTAGIRQMFAGRGNVEKAFGGAAEDLQRAIDALPQEQRDAMFAGGSKFMNVEIILPDTQNVIPYGKSVLVFHGSVEYDENGEEIGRSSQDGKTLSDQLIRVNAQQQKTFGISGPKTISFSDAQTVENKRALKELGEQIARMQQEYDLDDRSTIEDYKLAWWGKTVDNMGVEWTPEEREGIIRRWALGDKTFGVKNIEDPDKKKFFREFEGKELKRTQQKATQPLERIFLKTGALSLKRVTDMLSANNPKAAEELKQEVLDTIKKLKDTDDTNKLAALQIQVERLEDVGIDNIVPSEGMVFIYNGKPYKFTGAFAPVNQILGTLKFAKGEAEMTEPPKERSSEEPPIQPPTPSGQKRTVAIFTGRFQPFHAGHYSIYQEMVKRFGKENVFIATSDKTEAGTSPFGFSDKEQIMTTMFGIPEEMIVQVKRPYTPVEVLQTLPPETTYVTAVSQKDAERFRRGSYMEPYDDKSADKGYADKGYYIVTPELKVDVDGKNISGTQLRSIFGNPNITDEVKQEIFTKVYGKFDKGIFDKIVKTTTRSEEELKLTRQFGKEPKKPSGKKPEVEKQGKKERKPKAQPKSAAEFHKVGSTWPVGDKFAGKNSKSSIRYFNTDKAAKKFATT